MENELRGGGRGVVRSGSVTTWRVKGPGPSDSGRWEAVTGLHGTGGAPRIGYWGCRHVGSGLQCPV
jgi:hypothetical protein